MPNQNNNNSKPLLTRAECEEILRNIAGRQSYLLDYQLQSALDAVGYLGEYHHLTLNYAAPIVCDENHNKISECCDKQQSSIKLFVKNMPQYDEDPEKVRIFEKETRLYATLLQKLQQCSDIVWSPKCLYTRADLLVLEDLKQLDYQPRSKLAVSDMQQIMRSLAALHAASVVYEAQNQCSIGVRYADLLHEITVSPEVAWWRTGLHAIVAIAKQHPEYQTTKRREFLNTQFEKRLEAVYEMTAPSTIYRNVLCHRDPWSGNIFFKNSTTTTTAILYDFQTCRYCPPCIDVIFAIFMNLERAERTAHTPALILEYYRHFVANLRVHNIDAALHLSLQQLQQSYAACELFGYLYKAIAATILQVPPDFVTNHYKHVDRTQRVIEHMQQNATFRAYMQQCTADIVDLLTGADYAEAQSQGKADKIQTQ